MEAAAKADPWQVTSSLAIFPNNFCGDNVVTAKLSGDCQIVSRLYPAYSLQTEIAVMTIECYVGTI